MSNITLFKDNNALALPDYLKEGDDFTKAMAGGGTGKTISIEGGVWRMLVGGEEIAKNEDRAMNFVIVNGSRNISRVFYASAYVKGQVDTPACYSVDGKAPAENAVNPQSPNCATCKQNISGSGQNDSKACRYMQRLAVVLEGDMGGSIYRLQLPALSLFGKPVGDQMPFQAYARFLAGHNAPLRGVVTQARFDTSQSVPVLKFSAVRPLTKDEWAVANDQGNSEEALQAIDVKFTKPQEGATPQQALPAAFQQPAPKAAPAEEDEAPAPAPNKRSRKVEPPVIANKDVDSLIQSWSSSDDE